MRPFTPVGDTVNISITDTAQRIKIGQAATNIRIVNDCTETVFMEFGNKFVVANINTSLPIGAGVHEILNTDIAEQDYELYVSALSSGSVGNIYFTLGWGV